MIVWTLCFYIFIGGLVATALAISCTGPRGFDMPYPDKRCMPLWTGYQENGGSAP